MTLGNSKHFLGMKIEEDMEGISISQDLFIKDLLAQHSMTATPAIPEDLKEESDPLENKDHSIIWL